MEQIPNDGRDNDRGSELDDLLKELERDLTWRVGVLKKLVVPVVVGGGVLWTIALIVLFNSEKALRVLENTGPTLSHILGMEGSHERAFGLVTAAMSVYVVFALGWLAVAIAFWIAMAIKGLLGADLSGAGAAAKVQSHQMPLMELTLKRALEQQRLKFFRPVFDRDKQRWRYHHSAWRALLGIALVAGLLIAGLFHLADTRVSKSASRSAPAGESMQPVAQLFSVETDCGSPVELILAWKADGEEWKSGRWVVDSKGTPRLELNDQPVEATGSHFYYFAATTDGKFVWQAKRGDADVREIKIKGTTYRLRRVDLPEIQSQPQLTLVCGRE